MNQPESIGINKKIDKNQYAINANQQEFIGINRNQKESIRNKLKSIRIDRNQ